MQKITITDKLVTRDEITVDKHDAVREIRAWFPDPEPEVRTALDSLDDALYRGTETGDLAEYLGIEIRTAQ